MQKARLVESQAGIKIAERNINNLRYANDTILIAEREEEINSLLMNVKQERKKLTLKTKIMASGPIISWQIEREKMETVTDLLYFLGLQNHWGWWLQP